MPADAPAIDARRVLADLDELRRRTGSAAGAERLCWGDGWWRARALLGELLAELGLSAEIDEAGNAWAFLGGRDRPALALGSHLDSVPAGGWLDGALGVMAGLGVLRAWVEAGREPPHPLCLIDWADEEGARFGRSLFGSSAVCGTLDFAEIESARDGQGRGAAEVLAESGVHLPSARAAKERLRQIGAYLELHIEQGPRLDDANLAVAAVEGCVGIDRLLLRFEGAAGHAGTTPMDRRHDALLAGAEVALQAEKLARERGGMATCGRLRLEPNVPTVIPAVAAATVDLRHPTKAGLDELGSEVRNVAAKVASVRGCELAVRPVWGIEPIRFDPALVGAAGRLANGCQMVSGALHDAAEVARAGVPTAMYFCRSIDGVSHSADEDTDERDLTVAIERFADLTGRALGLM